MSGNEFDVVPSLDARQQAILETATRLWSAYLRGARALEQSDDPEHWAKMARRLVDGVTK